MRFVFVLMMFLTLSGCENYSYYPSDRERLAIEITRKVARNIKNETGLIPLGTGARTSNGVKMLGLAFECRKQLTVDSGRELLITALEAFRSEVNSDERIRPYLTNYPFEPKNVEIKIFIQKNDGSTFGLNELTVITAMDGILKYKISTPDGFGLETIYEESYEEAVEKLCASSFTQARR